MFTGLSEGERLGQVASPPQVQDISEIRAIYWRLVRPGEALWLSSLETASAVLADHGSNNDVFLAKWALLDFLSLD